MCETKKAENKFKSFIKNHKKGISFTFGTIGLTLAGVGIFKLVGAEPQKYSTKWFENVSDEVLDAEREIVRKQYCSSGDDFSLAIHLENLLRRFDSVISKRAWDGKEPGFPVHREHGWYLPNDD